MKASEHLIRAEHHVESAMSNTYAGHRDRAQNEALLAIAHALIANAVEGGVPHVPQAEQPTQS